MMRRLLVALALLAADAATSTASGDLDADCDGSAQLHALVALSGLRQQLTQCILPLLLMPSKWTNVDTSAAAYCKQDTCQRALAALAQLPSCVWAVGVLHGADEDDAVRMARQVYGDCGSGAN